MLEARFSKYHWREEGNGKVEGMENLLGRASTIQCFCHAKGNIQ